ncbi:LysR family transcriptional regulator [Variovorax sp. J22R133]|uniref:LysR family transcriptional regulator n=1 Tax=Variovorax brevis TaxID=3053503 RepID=UPI0025772173|nr:LysR family transcriptional regulator [Variovorax sp. J22R133]MDM0115130.1 LysR family transcriptional regulator [Variovorax sp. J22R133]
MDMRHLRCFVAVSEELHFGRAAERLHLTQPPVSLAIKELEEELGVTLLERTSRRIALTRAGEDALRDARAVLAAADTMRKRAREAAQGLMGTLSLGFISLPAYSFLPPTMRSFTEDYQRVKISLQEGTTDQIIHDVESGGLDVGLVFRTPDLPAALNTRLVHTEPLVVALPASHPMAGGTRIALEKLSNERFLGFERHQGPMMFDAIVATCMRHGFSPQLFPARQMHTIVSLVSGGIGVALVPGSVQALHREGVVYRSMKGEKTVVETVAVWRKSDDSPLVKALLSYLPKIPQRGG